MRLALALRRSALHILIVAAAAYLYHTTGTWEFVAPRGRLGPDVWPKAMLAALIAICGYAILRNFIFAHRAGGDAGTLEEIMRLTREGGDGAVEDEGRPLPHLVLIGIALFVVYVLVIETIGFLIATILLMAAFMHVGRWRNIPGILATSVIGGLAFFYVFRGVVYISLPLGQGPFQAVSLFLADLLNMR